MKKVTFDIAKELFKLGFPAPYSAECTCRDAYVVRGFEYSPSFSDSVITAKDGSLIVDYKFIWSEDMRCTASAMISAPDLNETIEFLRKQYSVYLSVGPYWRSSEGSPGDLSVKFRPLGYSKKSVLDEHSLEGSFASDLPHYYDYEKTLEELINLSIEKINCGEV
jgi:hypothetical protein